MWLLRVCERVCMTAAGGRVLPHRAGRTVHPRLHGPSSYLLRAHAPESLQVHLRHLAGARDRIRNLVEVLRRYMYLNYIVEVN